MIVGILGALGAAVLFGVASALQAKGARAAQPGSGGGVDARLMVGALGQRAYVVGLALDGGGFACELVALRRLPIYAVGGALAASLAVTAVAATRLLGAALDRTEWAAVGTVCGGLALLALSAGAEGHTPGGGALRWGTLAAAGAVLVAGAGAGRLRGRGRAAALGLCSGLGFGVVEVATRLVDGPASPALFALLLGGGAAFLLLTAAFSQGSVTTATAAMVVGETVGPALVGVVALGDRTREGWAPAAVAGFALALLGALVLARFGEGGTAPDPRVSPSEPARDGT